MTKLIRTNAENPEFRFLIALLDQYLHQQDGDEHAYYSQFNSIAGIKHVVLAYADDKAVGCGAFKPFDEQRIEIKRMYVLPEYRGKGVATAMLKELEAWAVEEGRTKAVLETGKRQPEAIALYHKVGYTDIPNFGQYEGVENSVCMARDLQ
ncbi:GNAT family N-acetyltransferase [Pedobacter sp. SYP-B3415]|uniref:GNAT family N-acetyltransferase n=1 Tax=Pedobacter sp. SYP-B3415 TaxID=2496641 RepID=UPI00101CC407|nr:GNAT family N-acetyltransferase [Pedobacter sp. SYP-B3415]